MKQERDLDLIRDLLLELEGVEEVDLSGYDQDAIRYNKYLIINAGFAKGEPLWGVDSNGKPMVMAAGLDHLTWSGQEFLSEARNPEAWRAVTGKIAEKGVDVSLAVVKSLLTAYMMQTFGID